MLFSKIERPAQFAQTVTEQLLAYALGRPVDYRDMPVVRQIVRNAAGETFRFASLVCQVVASDAFRRRDAAPPAKPAAAAPVVAAATGEK